MESVVGDQMLSARDEEEGGQIWVGLQEGLSYVWQNIAWVAG